MPSLAREAVGIGLRPPHYAELCASSTGEAHPAIDYVEAIADNYFEPGSRPRIWLERVAQRYPVVLHAVGLNLLGHAPLDTAYVDALADLAAATDAPFVSDHLCWTGAHGLVHHDLLPVPYTDEIVALAAHRARVVQEHLGRPLGLENLSSYVSFASSTMTDAEFYVRVVADSGCFAMLDVNNAYVSGQNFGFDPWTYLETVFRTLGPARILQVHLAGHERLPSGLRIDTHDRPVPDAVWELYRRAWHDFGPFATLVEWDDQIPSLHRLQREADYARLCRATPLTERLPATSTGISTDEAPWTTTRTATP